MQDNGALQIRDAQGVLQNGGGALMSSHPALPYHILSSGRFGDSGRGPSVCFAQSATKSSCSMTT